MKKIATILCVLVFSASVVFAQDKTRAIIEKAIQAHGGEAKVAKLRMMRIKAAGTTASVPGQPELPFTIEDTWQMPDRYKTSSTFQITGKKFAQTQIIDGDKGWITTSAQAWGPIVTPPTHSPVHSWVTFSHSLRPSRRLTKRRE